MTATLAWSFQPKTYSNTNAYFYAMVSNLEIRTGSGAWVSLDPAASYKLITNNFTAEGGDKYDTFKTIPAAQREDTFLDYADSFLQYGRSKGALTKPAAAERSTQGYVETP